MNNHFTASMNYALNATEAFEGACEHLITNGIETSPRGLTVKEIIGYNMWIADPRNRIVNSSARKISYRYLLAEWIWYLSGQSHVDTIKDYAPFWASIAAEDGTVNSNYGYRLFGYSPDVPYNQWEMVKEQFKKDPDTRQAVMHINASYDYIKPTKDRPCTLTLQWFIRDNQLILKVNMRSNDVVMGFGNDVFQFTMMQEMMLCQLRNEGFPNLELGPYLHDAGSMHVYDRHFDMIETVCKSIYDDSVPYVAPKPMKPMVCLKTDPQTLVYIEKKWRTEYKLDSSAETARKINEDEGFSYLSKYWQDAINVCFFGADKSLMLQD